MTTIEEYPDYTIDDMGIVRNKKNGKRLHGCYCLSGIKLNLRKGGTNNYMYLHYLMAKTFLENPNQYNSVTHKNRNKQDNRLCNIQWGTYSQNKKPQRKIYKFEKVFETEEELIQFKHALILLTNSFS
jgi:hypothetical protein